jgi:hypothetical protein
MANGKKTDAQQIGAAERRLQVLELRKQCKPFRAIGEQLGVSGKTAWQDYQQAMAELAELEQAEAETMRLLESARLDMAREALAPKVMRGNAEAIEAWRRLSESYRKLWGLDRPTLTALTNPDGTPLAMHYVELRAAVLAVLPPEQRLLVADALEVLNGDQSVDS